GPAPGGASGGSRPVLENPLASSDCGDGPGEGAPTRGSVGSWMGSAPVPKNDAVCGAPELFTNVTESPALMPAGTGAKASTSVLGVLAPISTVQVVEPSLLLDFTTGLAIRASLAPLPSASIVVRSASPRATMAPGSSASEALATTSSSPTIC